MPLNETIRPGPDQQVRPRTAQVDTGRYTVYGSRPDCPARGHDSDSAFRNLRCRCPVAILDHRRTDKLRRTGRLAPRRLSPVGTQRRIQAMRAQGWPTTEIASRLGITKAAVQCYLVNNGVTATIARRVHELYLDLAYRPGPSSRSRVTAARRGEVPAAAWDDIDDPDEQPWTPTDDTGEVDGVAVDEAMSYRLPLSRLTHAEQEAAVAALLRTCTAPEAAQRLQTSARQVDRVKARIRDRERREAAQAAESSEAA